MTPQTPAPGSTAAAPHNVRPPHSVTALLFYIYLLQRYIVGGLTAGAVKG